jgi:hypothetical protein
MIGGAEMKQTKVQKKNARFADMLEGMVGKNRASEEYRKKNRRIDARKRTGRKGQ